MKRKSICSLLKPFSLTEFKCVQNKRGKKICFRKISSLAFVNELRQTYEWQALKRPKKMIIYRQGWREENQTIKLKPDNQNVTLN